METHWLLWLAGHQTRENRIFKDKSKETVTECERGKLADARQNSDLSHSKKIGLRLSAFFIEINVGREEYLF